MKESIKEELLKMPKTEKHLHIEGALPFEMLQKLDSKKHAHSPYFWNDDFRFDSFSHFDTELLSMVLPWYDSPERYYQAAKEVFEGLLKKNVFYVETSFASGVLQFLGVDGKEVAEALHKACPDGLSLKVFLGMHHDGRPKNMEKVLEDALGWEYLDGIDLHGDETVKLEDWTAGYWKSARAAGKYTKAHAGEFCGADFVREVIERLGVKQIEHGVRSVEDKELLKYIVDNKIVLDVCPTSNVKLRVSESYKGHQIRELLSNGVLCTLNSDDPVIFGADTLDEYVNAMDKIGLSFEDCKRLAINGFKTSKLQEQDKTNFINRILSM